MRARRRRAGLAAPRVHHHRRRQHARLRRLYLLLRNFLAALAANALSLLLTAIANTAANRRLTFGIRGRSHAAPTRLEGLIAFAAGLALTSGALAGLHAAIAHAGRGAEVSVLVAANLVATVLRFLLYRTWVFGRRRSRVAEPLR